MRRMVRLLAWIMVGMGCVFLGNRLVPEPQAAERVAVAAVLPETEPQTQPQTEPAAMPVIQAPWRELVSDALAREREGVLFVCDGTGALRYSSIQGQERLYPASITKLFSAWVALQLLEPEEVVTAGWELGLLAPGSSVACISLDSQLTVANLVEGMLLPSGNDAALVLAAAAGRKLAGDKKITASEAVEAFVAEMNRQAAELGLENTHFVNPDGCHDEGHYSCPRDLGVIAGLALAEPLMARYMALDRDTAQLPYGQQITWHNTNRLLDPESEFYCPDAVGMKTGYTDAAGYCLMAAFGGDRPLVVGIFGSQDSVSRYEDAVKLWQVWQ